ncbi:MAG: M48 family metallopeptidase [Geitlerinemataceae cyanobacterium]
MPSYPGISSEAFRHPLDREAESALRSVPGFDMLARKFVEFVYERPQYIYNLGNHIEVGPRQYSTVYQIFRECVRDLDVSPTPALFVAQNAQVNAYALGEEQPTIVLHSGLLDLMNEDELRVVIAHELGHIKCGHTTLNQMAQWTISTLNAIGEMTFGLGNAIGMGLVYAFYEWKRKAELSSDRAALLVSDDLDTVMGTMMKMSGGSSKYAHEIDLKEFVRQSDRYHSQDEDNLNQIYKFLLANGGQGGFMTHPFPVERLAYLRDWSKSEEFAAIRNGDYVRCGAEGAVDVNSPASQQQPKASPETDRDDIEKIAREIDALKREIEREKAKQAGR